MVTQHKNLYANKIKTNYKKYYYHIWCKIKIKNKYN